MRPTMKQLSTSPNVRVIDNHTDRFMSDFVDIIGLGYTRKVKRYKAVKWGLCEKPKN